MSKPIILGYWDIHGLGSSIRYMLEYLNVDYVDELYKPEVADEWFNKKKDNLDLLYPNLPYLIDGDVKMTEHLPILRYLSRKYNLGPQTEEEIRISDQTESFISDARWKIVRAAYDDENYEAQKKIAIEQIGGKLKYLNKFFEKNQYVLGTRLTYVDILIFDILLATRVFEPSLINENPNLIRFIDMMSSLPNIAKYMKSSKFRNSNGEPRTFCAYFSKFKGSL